MKRSIVYGLAVLSAMALVLASCGKYEEGPGLSLRSKKGRLAGTWMVEKATATTNGTSFDYTSGFSGYSVTFEKDGSYTETVGSVSVTGSWEFNDDKMMIITTDNTGDKDTLKTIIRLTNKEFWLKDTYGNTTNEIHFMAM